MEMLIDFPGGVRVDAHFAGMTVRTDQPPGDGGEGSAPSPFALFQASLATCAGYYVLSFCRQRGLPAEGIRLLQRTVPDPATGLVGEIELEIQVPASFPEKYHDALLRAAAQCSVKKHLERPPRFAMKTTVQN
jgi:putative redox protein